MTVSQSPRSLTRRALINVAIRIAIVVAVASVISFFHVSHSLRTQALRQLSSTVEQRGLRESAILVLARDNLRTIANELGLRLQELGDRDPEASFDELFKRDAQGNTRLRKRHFDTSSITGFVSKNTIMHARLHRKLAVGYDLLAKYGPAWQNRFVNLYIATPENATLMFWPGRGWALDADEWQISAKLALANAGEGEVVVVTGAADEPGHAAWSSLYFDYAVNDWLVSVTEPVNLDGSLVATVGLDILLRELIDRTINDRLEGTYNLIFGQDGTLIAHPRFMDAIQASSGKLSVEDAGDPNLNRIFEQVTGASGSAIIENELDDEYLAVTRLNGPDWYFVTVFPEAIISEQALPTARWILLLGALALLLEIAILYLVLRKQVAEPLTSLMSATNRVAAGDFDVQLDERRDDEIGRLARSMNIMSREIKMRQTALSERSTKLAELNAQLETELTERQRAEEEVARQRETLHQRQKMNALGSLLAGVAHELNNPLSVVVGRAIMLEDQLKETRQASSVDKIRSAAERCSRIVKTFLAMARQQKPSRKSVYLDELIEAALDLVGYGLRSDGVKVSIELPQGLPSLNVDPDQLVQVLSNLFINAQQAMSTQGDGRRIVVNARHDLPAHQVRVRVSDSGPGIPAAVLPHIFDPFYTTKGVGQGTGMGLSVSHGILQAHGGDIRVLADGAGATFEICLPVGAEPATDDGASAQAPGGHQQRILVVDDEADVASLLAEILSRAGYGVTTASSGRAALESLGSQPCDLVISDLRMPDMDGRALYGALKENHPMLAERIVFVTGDTRSDAVQSFRQSMPQPVIEKPFVPEDVRNVVAQTLVGSQA